jgi:Trk-type K+ transport system membrane component
MPKFDFKKLDANLEIQGFNDPQTKEKIISAIKSVPEKTYDKAVIFLGFATLIVAVGGILLAALNKTVPDALWTALGAGIGGLAGIFTGKE